MDGILETSDRMYSSYTVLWSRLPQKDIEARSNRGHIWTNLIKI